AGCSGGEVGGGGGGGRGGLAVEAHPPPPPPHPVRLKSAMLYGCGWRRAGYFCVACATSRTGPPLPVGSGMTVTVKTSLSFFVHTAVPPLGMDGIEAPPAASFQPAEVRESL